MILFFAVSSVDAIFHIFDDGIMAVRMMINHALDIIEVDGSKVENKLVIIFNFFLFLLFFFLLVFRF